MIKRFLAFTALMFIVISCKKDEIKKIITTQPTVITESINSFKEISTFIVGGAGAAEISAYDEVSKRLFVVNNSNTNRIEIIDISNPSMPKLAGNINLSIYNGASNSVSCYGGKLAVALESTINKQDAGKVVIFNVTTNTPSEITQVPVGALPDMITFSADGKYIMTANEGEPNDAYTNDPDGSISIIETLNNYAVTTLTFSSFTTQLAVLKNAGFRTFGPSANNLSKDVEPEYITISEDSKTAWVSLQENNAIAKVDIVNKTITNIFPLGFKDYNNSENAIDISDQDGGINFAAWKAKGMYEPDALYNFENEGVPFIITANEGDQREYGGFNEVKRISSSSVILDPVAFPNASALKTNTQMGRLNITTTLGDIDGDGDFDELYSFGGRSFSIWNGNTGQLIFDSKNDLDKKALAIGLYDDARSDDKGSEPESIAIGTIGSKKILFVGTERADGLLTYDITLPSFPVFLQNLKTGDAPEGLLFIPASKSPNKRSLLVVSSENDGTVRIYQPDIL